MLQLFGQPSGLMRQPPQTRDRAAAQDGVVSGEGEMIDIRKDVHEEIDRMTARQVAGLKKFLATYPRRLAATLRNARNRMNRKPGKKHGWCRRPRNGPGKAAAMVSRTRRSNENFA